MRTPETFARPANYLRLESLNSLPCGCVAAIFWLDRRDIRVMSVEAKGPYCRAAGHVAERIVEPFEENEGFESGLVA